RDVRLRAHLLANLEAVDPGQADVEDHDPHRLPLQLVDRLLAAVDPDHAPAVLGEVLLDQPPNRVVVLDEQDDAPCRLPAHGDGGGCVGSTWIRLTGPVPLRTTRTRIEGWSCRTSATAPGPTILALRAT